MSFCPGCGYNLSNILLKKRTLEVPKVEKKTVEKSQHQIDDDNAMEQVVRKITYKKKLTAKQQAHLDNLHEVSRAKKELKLQKQNQNDEFTSDEEPEIVYRKLKKVAEEQEQEIEQQEPEYTLLF